MKSIIKILLINTLFVNSLLLSAQSNAFLLGKASFEKMDYQMANQYLSTFLTKYPKHQEARILRAKSNLFLLNYAKAEEDLADIKTTKNEEVLLLQARAYAGQGNTKLAFEKLSQYSTTNNKVAEEMVKSFPEFTVIKNSNEWKNLWLNWKYSEKENSLNNIRYAVKSGRVGEAADRLDLFLQKYKTNSEAYYLRGNLYFAQKDFKNAENCYENAEMNESSNKEYLLYLAKVHHYLKKDKKALEEYNSIIEKDSLQIEAFLGRSQVFYSLLDYQQALNDVSAYRQYYPDNLDAQFTEAQVNVKLGDFLSAIGEFGKLIKSNPGNPEYFIGRADAYSETKTYTYAIKDYAMALDLDPNNIDTYKKKAKAFQLSGDLKGACNEWDHAVRHGDIESMNFIQKYCKN